MTSTQLEAYKRMGFSERPAYLVRIGEARSYSEALAQINSRRRAIREQNRQHASRMATRREEIARRIAGSFD